MQTNIERRNQENYSDRKFILMVAAPLNLTPTASWPPPGGVLVKHPVNVIGVAMNMNVSFGYGQELLQLPADAGAGHLHFDQLSLLQLAQGFKEEGEGAVSMPRRMLRSEMDLSVNAWALLMWAVSRWVLGG